MRLQLNEEKHFKLSKVNKLKESLHKNNVIMLLHADWCYHCKTFLPEWNKFVQSPKQKQMKNLAIVEIESTQLGKVSQQDPNLHDLLTGKGELIGFPTIVLFKNGQRYTYNGNRLKEALENSLSDFITGKENKLISLSKQAGGKASDKAPKSRSAASGGALEKLEKKLDRVILKHFGKST